MDENELLDKLYEYKDKKLTIDDLLDIARLVLRLHKTIANKND